MTVAAPTRAHALHAAIKCWPAVVMRALNPQLHQVVGLLPHCIQKLRSTLALPSPASASYPEIDGI
jgi:hypothetical protein